MYQKHPSINGNRKCCFSFRFCSRLYVFSDSLSPLAPTTCLCCNFENVNWGKMKRKIFRAILIWFFRDASPIHWCVCVCVCAGACQIYKFFSGSFSIFETSFSSSSVYLGCDTSAEWYQEKIPRPTISTTKQMNTRFESNHHFKIWIKLFSSFSMLYLWS